MKSADRKVCDAFLEEAAVKDLQFMDQVADLLEGVAPSEPLKTTGSDGASPSITDVESFVATANAPQHSIRNQLLHLTADSPNLFAVIQQEGRV